VGARMTIKKGTTIKQFPSCDCERGRTFNRWSRNQARYQIWGSWFGSQPS